MHFSHQPAILMFFFVIFSLQVAAVRFNGCLYFRTCGGLPVVLLLLMIYANQPKIMLVTQ